MIKRGKWGELRVEAGREGDDGVGEVGGVDEGGRSPMMVVVFVGRGLVTLSTRNRKVVR